MLKKFFRFSIELSNHNSTVPIFTGKPDRFISILISCVIVILLFINEKEGQKPFYYPSGVTGDSSGSVSNRILQLNASYSDAGPDPATGSVTVARPTHSFSPFDATTRCQILRPSPTLYFSPAINSWAGSVAS